VKWNNSASPLVSDGDCKCGNRNLNLDFFPFKYYPVSSNNGIRFYLVKLLHMNQIPLWFMPSYNKLVRPRAYQGNDREGSLLCKKLK
jgi:hypothetical protein